MTKKLNCPECGHNQLHCNATIKAVLTTKQYEDGGWDYELFEWDDIEDIESYNCRECGFEFIGNEEGFIEHVETVKSAVEQ